MTKRVVGYFENWAQYRESGGKFLPAQINPSFFTHINFAFGLIGFVTWSVDPNPARTGSQRYTGDYTVQPVEWNDQTALYPAIQALKQQNGSLKTLLSIGGWSMNSCSDTPNSGNPHPYGPYTCQLFSQMAADPNGRTQFINSAIAYARKYGFDGIDIDWEYPGYVGRGGGPNDLANFLALVQELRAVAGPNFLLTMASPAIVPTGLPQAYHDNPSTFFQWLQQCSQSLDWLNVMSYDYHGAFDDPVKMGTGVNSPLVQDSTPNGPFSIKQTVTTYLAAGIAGDKMVLGMPTYGRGYMVANPGALASNSGYGQPFSGPSPAGPATQVPGVLAYYEITQQIASGALTPEWDAATLTPYAYNATTGQWVSYDNPDSVAYKTAYVNAMGLGGAMIWSIDDDDFANGYPLLTKITDLLNNPADGPSLPRPPGITGRDMLWSTDREVPTQATAYGITGTPALAELNGTLYCVHRGGGNDSGHLWWATSDGYSWANEQMLVTTAGGPVGAYGAPALAAFNGHLYCIHPGGGNDPGHLWWTVFNGTSWAPDQQLTTTAGGPVGTSGAAALAALNGTLYCVHPGSGGDSTLWYTSFDGTSWAPDQQIKTRDGLHLVAGSSPAVAVFNNELYCLYVNDASGGSTEVSSAVFDGQVWDIGQPVGATINSTESPAAVVYQNLLWCIHGDGQGFQGYLGGAVFDGAQWSADQQIMTGLQHDGVVGTSAAPGLAVLHDTLHCVHPGGGGPSTYLWETTTPPAQLQSGRTWPNTIVLVHGYASSDAVKKKAKNGAGNVSDFWYWQGKYSDNETTYDVPNDLINAAAGAGAKVQIVAANWNGVSIIETSVNDLVDVLDQYCAGSNTCDLVGHSTGDALIGYALDKYQDHGWNINTVFVAGGAGGGTEAADWQVNVGGYFSPTDPVVAQLQPQVMRALYNHDMSGNYAAVPNIRFVGAGTGYDNANNIRYSAGAAFCRGTSDGLVPFHSQGGVSQYMGNTAVQAYDAYCIQKHTGAIFSCGQLHLGNADAERWTLNAYVNVPLFKGFWVAMIDDGRLYNHTDEVGRLAHWIVNYKIGQITVARAGTPAELYATRTVTPPPPAHRLQPGERPPPPPPPPVVVAKSDGQSNEAGDLVEAALSA